MINFRSFESADCAQLLAYLNDDRVTRYITASIPRPYQLADAQWWIDVGSQSPHIKAIEFDGVFVGCISASRGNFEYSRSAELGYWLAPQYWNRGIATQAVNEFSQHLFTSTDIVRLFVSVVAANVASIRVLEKNGFSHDGLLRNASYKNGTFFDEVILSKLISTK